MVGGATTTQIRDVIIQEIGHSIDARLNAVDTAGDEGDAFASAVLGSPYIDGIVDSGNITVDGLSYSVEFAQLSVPFPQGFIGTVGSSNNAANNIRTFATLGITKASFFQNSSGASFIAQGNDIPGGVRLQLSSGQVLEVNGTINWRHTQGSTLYAFGFIPSPTITPISFSYGAGQTFTINSSSNFGLKLIGAAYSYTDTENISGNAATNGLLDALNSYLASIEASNPNGPISVNTQTTADTTPTITGSATLAAGETLSITVGGKTYTTSTGLAIDSGTNTWSLTIPDGSPLTGGTYDVTAIITNASGYTLTDSSNAELVITAGDTTPPNISLSTNLATLGAGDSAIISFSLSESSTDFSLSDITLTNTSGTATGTLSNFIGSGSNYSVTFTPSPGVSGTVSISVGSGAFSDAANNQNTDGADLNNSVSLSVNTSAVSVSVAGSIVSESSPYAMFQVSLSAASDGTVVFTPTLLSDSAIVGTDTGLGLEYFDGTSWTSAAGGVTIAAGQTSVLLRAGVTNDTSYEGSEVFSLSTGAITGTGTVTNATGAVGSSTIKDDGSTTNTFLGTNNSFSPTIGMGDNDSGLSINSLTVNEDSPYAIFTISGQSGQQVLLDINGISAIEDIDGDRADPTDDFGPIIEYWDGTTWVTYDPSENGGYVSMPSSGTMLVRTAVIDDNITEGNLTFSLTVTPSTGSAVTGIATINDQGAGTIFTSDSPIAVSGVPIAPVNELLAKDNDLTDRTTVFNLSAPASIEVGGSLQVTDINSGSTGSGIYKMVADDQTKTATLYHYDLDGTTLSGSERIDISDNLVLSSNESRTLIFEKLGVVLTLQNLSYNEVTIGSEASGLRELVTVAISRLESALGERGFVFQTGERARKNDFSIDAFRDIRLTGNTDSRYGEIFNKYGTEIDAVNAGLAVGVQDLHTLVNLTDTILESIVRKRVSIGALENRLLHNIQQLGTLDSSFTGALSSIQDVDYARETSSLARQQILQQATVAMLAQANAIPNVVLSLLTNTSLQASRTLR